MNMNLGSTA